MLLLALLAACVGSDSESRRDGTQWRSAQTDTDDTTPEVETSGSTSDTPADLDAIDGCKLHVEPPVTASFPAVAAESDVVILTGTVDLLISNQMPQAVTLTPRAVVRLSGQRHLFVGEPAVLNAGDTILSTINILPEGADTHDLDYPASVNVHVEVSRDGETIALAALPTLFYYGGVGGSLIVFDDHGLITRHNRGDLKLQHSWDETSLPEAVGRGVALDPGGYYGDPEDPKPTGNTSTGF